MSPRGLGLAVLMLVIWVVLTVAMLAAQSAKLDQFITRTPHTLSARDIPGPPGAGCCGEAAREERVASHWSPGRPSGC